MSAATRLFRILAVCVLAAGLGACASNYPTRTLSNADTAIDRPIKPPSDAELLSVRIEAFDAGALPEDPNLSRGLSPEIRSAEAYYIPVQLKNTMQRSGHWGSVRVVPKGMREGEVVVSGQILESDGEILKLRIDVKDAAGVPWFGKEYESVIDSAAYRKAEQGGVDPYQNLYNRIANDVAAYRKTLKPEDNSSLRKVADLRFGTEFAPETYQAYLQRQEEAAPQGDLQRLIAFMNSGRLASTRNPTYTVARLPSEEDPIVQRVNRIRAREELLVDTLDQQYDGLARGVSGAYTQWRGSRLKEIHAIRETDRVKNEEQAKAVAIGVLGVLAGAAVASQNRGGSCYNCTTAGVAVATVAVAYAVQAAMKASEQASAEVSMHKAALEELGNSLASDVKPTVVEVEGQTVELRGTVEEKFQKWREVLKGLRDNETTPMTSTSGTPSS
ncbi:MAG: hypothetical protein FJX55_08395 [Alphaproteobacteria bacterium]|nr:hypothetical protein [Alphaproteobacteria bacterium]